MKTDGMENIGILMSNLYFNVDGGTEQLLRQRPNEIYCGYAAWNFFAKVYYNGENFVAEVKVWGVFQQSIEAATLEELMEKTSAIYGRD